jgi:hypothetical protein
MLRISPESRERHQRLWAALLCGGVGLTFGYMVWARRPGLLVPPGVGYLAAGSFLAAGLTLLLQAWGHARVALVPAFLVVAAMAGIGGWWGSAPAVGAVRAVWAPYTSCLVSWFAGQCLAPARCSLG